MHETAIAPKPSASDKGEILFEARRILTTATDLRGVIRYANPAFCEIAKYAAQDLIGTPDKVFRHPDMPRGVFYLLLERLKSGLPACAYFKKRASDGKYFQVFATVTQIPDGYLSVQIKPQSDLRATTLELYGDLLFEEANGLTPEECARRLQLRLADTGFSTFDAYMSAALDAEFGLRQDNVGKSGSSLSCITELDGLIERAETLVGNIADVFGQVRGEPVNLRILAGRMEEAGAAIATISKNYETMAADMYHLVERLSDDRSGILTRMRSAINRGRFAAQIAELMQMAKQQSADHEALSELDDSNANLLAEQAERLGEASRAALSEIIAIGQTFPDTSRQLRRRINGLDLVKLLCRVESGRIGDIDSGLNGIIERLEQAHQSTDRYLSELSALSAQINCRSKAL